MQQMARPHASHEAVQRFQLEQIGTVTDQSRRVVIGQVT
jgi:hypothetical protein